MEPLNIFEYESLAQERLDPVYWDFYAGGSDDETTLRANQDDFARLRLRPRVLVDTSRCDTSTSLLGVSVPMALNAALSLRVGLVLNLAPPIFGNAGRRRCRCSTSTP